MTRPARVLSVGPSPREVVAEVFESVDCVRTLAACLSALEDNGYDCVVVDSPLSDATGPEVVEAIRETRPGVPLVVWTDGTDVLAGEVIAAGADGYVPKSAGVGTLAERVAGVTEQVATGLDSGADDLDDAYASGIVEAIGDAICVLDREEVIRRVNDTLASLSGYPREELVGAHVSTMLTAESLERGRSEIATLRAGEQSAVTYEQTIETRSGERIPCEVTAALLREGGAVVGIAAVIRDVRDRVEIERELWARRRKTTALHEVASTLEDCGSEAEVFETAVAAAEEVLNFDVCAIDRVEGDRLVKAALSSKLTDADIRREFSIDEGIVGKTYRNGRTYRIGDVASDPDAVPAGEEFRSVLSVPIGEWGVFQTVSTEPDAFDRSDRELAELLVAHVADALDRMAFESRLREERDRFAALFENVPDAVASVRHEGDEAIVERVNPAFERVFGYDESTIAGEPLDRFVVPDGDDEEAEAVNRAGADGAVVEREVRRRTAAGIREFRLEIVPIETDRETSRSFGVYTDITERKRRRQRLEVLNRVLRHDLRNGLNVIDGSAVTLAESVDDDDREYVETIRERAGDLLELAETTRDIERSFDRAPAAAGPVDVVAAVREGIDRATATAPGARIEASLPDRAEARAGGVLSTAIAHVIENAVEHAGEAPTVEVRVETTDETVTISVADDGPGVPEVEREILAGGEITQLRHASGLGLWLVKWAVGQSGGELSFSENDPRGTVVTLEVPAADPPGERATGGPDGAG
ncbi:PAS domain S-box protein [Saliphagus sp. LR7]|uniref:PAS domain S-box protein n=1 Tax=Saliphagus sp. LR7 TaxID=2282654 RepID=UPI000DF74CCF|nr:PAS domain S-box protein [Saliphagus sp. LR7]